MGKGLSKGMIDMYLELVDKKYDPLISFLKAKSAVFAPKIEIQVKKDLGIYDLMMEQKTLELRLKEINDSLESYTSRRYGRYENGVYMRGLSEVDAEINRRLTEMNEPLMQVEAAKESANEKIKLMAAGEDVKKMFENIAAEIAMMTEKFKNAVLPGTEKLAEIEMPDIDAAAA